MKYHVANEQQRSIQADFHFNATCVSSLVTANGIGTLRGSGTLNDSNTYNYLVVGNENTTTIRIQIKDTSGAILYDSEPKINGETAPDTTDPTTVVTAGNVLAH